MSRPSTPRPVPRRTVLALALLTLTACAMDDDRSGATPTAAQPPTSPAKTGAPESTAPAASPGPTQAQTVTATEGEMYIRLSQEEFTAGSLTIEVTNEGSASHDLVVERDGNDVAGTDLIAPGGSATLTVELEPGEYVFYCSVANHRAMGMEVAVTVT